ncbi:uncharacterized protein LOC108906399 [Anoplophora glabripennis]|uniref:uncharacterized protein LOC108906399 n=1 Tax=Anoplophora glabripennis TaxID=217634 RepID=UPI0008735F49|nr:uncharacterized protein LOC108906399 [Anoplophora glabripennis]
MHRSVTFSEIFSSTFSDDLNRYGESSDQNVKAKFVTKIGIGLVEFILSSIFLCYGIIFSECVSLQVCTVENGLWTTILYTAAWYAAGPWSKHICEYFENNKYNVFRYTICAATVFLFVGFLIPGQIISYGLFGGIFSNFISVQLKFIATERYDMDLKTYEGNVQVARALNLLLMPHFVLLLTSYYDMYQVKLIFAAFLLNIIPATLIIKPYEIEQRDPEISRYQTLPAFSNQIREMMEFTNSVHTTSNNTPDLSSDSDDEDKEDVIILPSGREDDDLTYDDTNDVNEQLLQPIQLTPYNVQTYYSKVGVSILPGIPEEMENEEMNDAIDTINSRRISKISMRLEEINQLSKKASEEQQHMQRVPHLDPEATPGDKMSGEILNVKTLETNGAPEEPEIRINGNQHTFYASEVNDTPDPEILDINTLVSNKQLEEPDRIENIEYIHNYGGTKPRFFKEFRTVKSGYCCGCSPYRKFIWKRRYRTVMDFFIDNIFKPLWVSLKDLHFYPTVLSKVVTAISATMCFTLTPYIALKKNSSFQPEDATILLSYVAFSWCLFLVLLPLVINFSKAKFRATFICGLVLAGTCMILISKKMTNDIMTISCLLYGFGYGIISYTENMVYRSFVGVRKWDQIQGTLETTTAIIVILTYYIIYRYSLNLNFLLLVALIVHYLIAILWTIAPILKDIIIFCSKYYCRKEDQQIVI